MPHLAIADWVLIAIVVVSTLISLKRGFVKEALSLGAWIVAVLIARIFGGQVSTLLEGVVSVPSVRLMIAYGSLFVATLAVGSMINHLISHVVEMTGLSGTDRVLGTVFGLGRGVLIIVIIVAVLTRAPVTDDAWYKRSVLIPHLSSIANKIQEWIFNDIGKASRQSRLHLVR